MYIFEIILKTKNEKNKKIRKIMKIHKGILLSEEDNIRYDSIKKICITAIDLNNPIKEINGEYILNNNSNLILNNNLLIEFYENNKLLECNYIII
jgi:hypothetical protein